MYNPSPGQDWVNVCHKVRATCLICNEFFNSIQQSFYMCELKRIDKNLQTIALKPSLTRALFKCTNNRFYAPVGFFKQLRLVVIAHQNCHVKQVVDHRVPKELDRKILSAFIR